MQLRLHSVRSGDEQAAARALNSMNMCSVRSARGQIERGEQSAGSGGRSWRFGTFLRGGAWASSPRRNVPPAQTGRLALSRHPMH